MISLSAVESCKVLEEVLTNLIPGEMAFAIVENATIVWWEQSGAFSSDMFAAESAISKKLSIVSIPIIKDHGEADNAFSMAFPRVSILAAVWGDSAPILAEMFPEGAFIYLSDLEKIACGKETPDFDGTSLTVGHIQNENDISYKVIKLKQSVLTEVDISKYGTSVFVATYPLYDAENTEEIVATLGIITPKKIPASLPKMSSIIEGGLSEISATVKELTVSALIREVNKMSNVL